jgi:hypothetical protein
MLVANEQNNPNVAHTNYLLSPTILVKMMSTTKTTENQFQHLLNDDMVNAVKRGHEATVVRSSSRSSSYELKQFNFIYYNETTPNSPRDARQLRGTKVIVEVPSSTTMHYEYYFLLLLLGVRCYLLLATC